LKEVTSSEQLQEGVGVIKHHGKFRDSITGEFSDCFYSLRDTMFNKLPGYLKLTAV
jgi:hypothetical protein